MTDPPVEKMTQLADAAARKYAVPTAWAVSADDVRQAALCAQVDAFRRWDPARKVDLGAFLWAAARRGAKRYVVRAQNPCTATPGVREAERAGRMRWVSREGTDATAPGEEPSGEERREVAALNAGSEPDVLAAELEFRVRVAQRVAELVGPRGAEFALGVLGGEWDDREVAAAHGTPVSDVTALRRAITATLRGDDVLFRLWETRLQEQPDHE